MKIVFVPFRGFLFFYTNCISSFIEATIKFSSPSGAFYFSILLLLLLLLFRLKFSSPSGAFYFSIS